MSSITAILQSPPPRNEPCLGFAPGSSERSSLEAELARQSGEIIEIPCVVGGREVRTGNVVDVVMPCDHGHVLARAHLATPELIDESISSSLAAQADWGNLPWQERAAVFLRAAELLSGPWRDRLNASTMLGQAKTCIQAEIDSACEIIDFWRFNVEFTRQILSEQPQSSPGVWNQFDQRPLEGFIASITPFNFTSIALNLPTAPALVGNTGIWKPATTQLLSAWYGHELLREAGLPPGVINFIPSRGSQFGPIITRSPHLAGLHFTGGTNTFQTLWRSVGENIANYRTYPRLVGETGGKDFILAHPTADPAALVTAIVRGGYEYQGQKCSAASRIYVPESLWADIRDPLIGEIEQLRMGDTRDFSNFIGAVISAKAFRDHSGYLDVAHQSARVLTGGQADDRVGWYIEPTLVQVDDPCHRLMAEEIFGPIVTVWVYPDKDWDRVLQLVDTTSPYALTGAIFARDRYAIEGAKKQLRHAAGNLYINDKPTGAVVGQQPFGGARASGTNDKAGSPLNLLRWLSPRTIKETFVPAKDWRYPFLG